MAFTNRRPYPPVIRTLNPINTVNNDNQPDLNQLPEAAKDAARHAADAAKETAQKAHYAVKDIIADTKEASQTLFSDVEHGVEQAKSNAQHAVEVVKDKAHHASDVAKDMYQSARLKAEDTLATSREYVERNPVPSVLGAIAFGAVVGGLLMLATRRRSFGERYVDAPMDSMREMFLSALAPVTHRVHDGYDSARHHVGKSLGRAHRSCSVSDQLGRVGRNLKFW